MTTTVVLFNGEVYKEVEKEAYEWAQKREFSRFTIVFEGTLKEFADEKSKKHATKVATFEEVSFNSYKLVWAEKPVQEEKKELESNVSEEIDLKKYSGKDEKINGKWYPVTINANNYKEALKKLYPGMKHSYGIVEAVRGRFKEEN